MIKLYKTLSIIFIAFNINIFSQECEYKLLKLLDASTNKNYVLQFSNPIAIELNLSKIEDVKIDLFKLIENQTTLDSIKSTDRIKTYNFSMLGKGKYLFLWSGFDVSNNQKIKGDFFYKVYLADSLYQQNKFTIN